MFSVDRLSGVAAVMAAPPRTLAGHALAAGCPRSRTPVAGAGAADRLAPGDDRRRPEDGRRSKNRGRPEEAQAHPKKRERRRRATTGVPGQGDQWRSGGGRGQTAVIA